MWYHQSYLQIATETNEWSKCQNRTANQINNHCFLGLKRDLGWFEVGQKISLLAIEQLNKKGIKSLRESNRKNKKI